MNIKCMSEEQFNWMADNYPAPLLKADGYDDCVVGICERAGQPDIIAYSTGAVVEKLMRRDGMTQEEAPGPSFGPGLWVARRRLNSTIVSSWFSQWLARAESPTATLYLSDAEVFIGASSL